MLPITSWSLLLLLVTVKVAISNTMSLDKDVVYT